MSGLGDLPYSARDRDGSRDSRGRWEVSPLLAAEQGQAGRDRSTSSTTPRQDLRRGGGNPALNGANAPPTIGAFNGAAPNAYQLGQAGGSGGSETGSSGGQGKEKPLDVAQFASMFFYVTEGRGKVDVSVMRIGSLVDPCSINWHTEDGSAKCGLKYVTAEGTIEFAPNEEMKSVEVKIVDDDSFDTNLDFSVVLSDPLNCQLGENHFQSCRVIIIDDDVFPTNQYRDAIMRDDMDDVGVRLLYSFIKFAILRIPQVRFRTIMTFMMDQMYNVSYLWGIWLNIYCVDVVFAIHKEETLDRCWVSYFEDPMRNRFATCVLVAFGFIIPKAILNYIEFLKEGDLCVGGKVKLHLKVNLFRKYLYYNQASHAKVTPQELTKAMQDDIDELVKYGYMVIFKIAQQLVKVAVILYFLVKKQPSSALPMLVYPVAMVLVLNLRYEKTLVYKDELREAEKTTMQRLRESCDDINLIKEYNMRNAVVGTFETCLRAEGPAGNNYDLYDFWTMLIMPWITNFSIMIFMILGGHFVLSGSLSLGAYLATIGIYKDAGELFSGFYGHLKDCYGVIGPLLRIIRLLNLDTDVNGAMAQAKERTEGMMKILEQDAHSRKPVLGADGNSRFDSLPLRLVQASLANDRGGPLFPKLQDLSFGVPQGKLVSVLGPHGSGKFSLLKLLTGLVKPVHGEVHVPTHLRCICVPNVPEIFKNGNLLENLTFGAKGKNKEDRGRLLKICEAVNLSQHTINLIQEDMKSEDRASEEVKKRRDNGVPWYDELSQSELLKMHIIRALNINPEVLLLHRPVDQMEADHAARILDVLRRQVDERGIFSAPETRVSNRPHTVIFTTGQDRERADSATDISDMVWHLSEAGFRAEPGGQEGGDKHKEGGENKIVVSWSRQSKTLQKSFDDEKERHNDTMSDLQNHKSEIEDLRSQAEQFRGQLNDVTSQAKRALRDAKAYEAEMQQWETHEKEESGGWMQCVGDRGGKQPTPRADLTRTLADIISTGESRGDARSRGASAPPRGYTDAVRSDPADHKDQGPMDWGFGKTVSR